MRKLILIAVSVSLGLFGGLSSPVGHGQGLTEAAAVAKVIGIVSLGVGGPRGTDNLVLEISYIFGGEGLAMVKPYLLMTEGSQGYSDCNGETLKYAVNLLVGRTVWLSHYGRTAEFLTWPSRSAYTLYAFIYLDSEKTASFQAMMVSQGLAKLRDAGTQLEEEKGFWEQMERLQDEAQASGRGLWGACP
jgi:hypothetical protein